MRNLPTNNEYHPYPTHILPDISSLGCFSWLKAKNKKPSFFCKLCAEILKSKVKVEMISFHEDLQWKLDILNCCLVLMSPGGQGMVWIKKK